jgi:hypothetical protein
VLRWELPGEQDPLLQVSHPPLNRALPGAKTVGGGGIIARLVDRDGQADIGPRQIEQLLP